MTNQRRTMLNTIKNNNFVSKEESAEKLEKSLHWRTHAHMLELNRRIPLKRW